MSSASSLTEVDITNLKKLSPSSEDQKGHLNPDAAVFKAGLVSKDSLKNPEIQLEQDFKEEMPSPQVLPNTDGSVVVNGGEPPIFAEPHAGGRQNIPEHIKPDELPKDELRTLVRQQLEYYFSRENLAGDTYLVSQMDSDQYVLIQIVANFNQMKKLTNDIEIVKEAIKESAYLQMDESQMKMRPNMKRCIVILREVPESTSVEEVEELFSGEGCPKYISCEPANNNYWYIQFENEECAQKAYRYLREDIKTFKGKPIMARIKAKPIPRTASNFVQKNGMRPNSEPSTISSSPFRYPVSPLYGNHQGYSFFQPTVLSQWPGGQHGQHFYDPTMIPGLANNTFHSPQNFNKANNHQGNRPYYQNNRNRNQTRSYRETSERVDKDSSQYRPRAHSTNGTTNTTNSSTVSSNSVGGNKSPLNTASNSFMNWKRNEDDNRLGSRTRRRRGSSEDIRPSRSPIPQEPQRSKDDSHFTLSTAQFPPLPTTTTFKPSDLPLQSPNTRQEYNKVASSPPLSPPVTPTSTPWVTTSKPEKEEAKDKTINEVNDPPVKKEEMKKTEIPKNEPEPSSKDTTKENAKTTWLDKTKETLLNEKLSYAQIAQKKAMQNKQTNVTTTTPVTTTTNTQS